MRKAIPAGCRRPCPSSSWGERTRAEVSAESLHSWPKRVRPRSDALLSAHLLLHDTPELSVPQLTPLLAACSLGEGESEKRSRPSMSRARRPKWEESAYRNVLKAQ